MNLIETLSTEHVIESEKLLLEAMTSSDVEIQDEILHDDLLFVIPNGQTITKQMDLDSHRSGSMIINQIASTLETVNIIEDSAVVTLLVKTEGLMLGKNFEGEFRYIRVWKLCGKKLKVIAGSCTPV